MSPPCLDSVISLCAPAADEGRMLFQAPWRLDFLALAILFDVQFLLEDGIGNKRVKETLDPGGSIR